VSAVGLRQKALPKCFLLATTASMVFQQPISAHQCPLVVKNPIRIRDHPFYPREQSLIGISDNQCTSVAKPTSFALFATLM
jgi:hypothetical protein